MVCLLIEMFYVADNVSFQVTDLVLRIYFLHTVGLNVTTKVNDCSVNRSEPTANNIQYQIRLAGLIITYLNH